MQSAAQFTPEQLIVAGRRAEAQGQIGYALQFYRYLAEKYPNTAEAFEARDALFRLHGSDGQPQTQPGSKTVQAPRPASVARARPPEAAEAAVPGGRQATAELSVPVHDRVAKHTAERRGTKSADHSDAPDGAPAPGYRTGRFVAAILSTLGWLQLLVVVLGGVGLVGLLTIKAAPKPLHDLATANLLVVVGGLTGALLLGLLCVFAGQVARAAFDTADLTRWLASAMTHEHDQHDH